MKKIILSMLVAVAGFRASAQFQQNFDAAAALPTGWSTINGGDPNEWSISSSISGGAHSGSNAASITYNSTIAHDDYFITPQIVVTENVSTRLSFWIKSRSASFLEPYEVRLSTTNNTSAAAFSVVLQPEEEAAAAWTKKEFNLSNYIGQSVYIAIRATGLDEFNLYADDFVSDALPTCPPVGYLTASAISATSATISWNGNAANFQYALAPSTTTDPNAVTAVDVPGAMTATLALEPNTSYNAWVRAVCDGSVGDWTDAVTFTTPCAAITAASLPWTEGFESITTVGSSAFPSCWFKENGDWRTANASSSSYDSNAHSGTIFVTDSWSATNEKLWTPGFELVANQTYNFSFWYASFQDPADDAYDDWDLSVMVNSAQSATGAQMVGNPVVSAGQLAPTTYTQVTRSFSPAANGTYYFALNVSANSTPWYLSFDDFSLQASSLATAEVEAGEFKFFPNPVHNVLNVSNSDVINAAEVYNLLGQKVLDKKVNATEAALDFSALQIGTYIVKVATANAVKTIKIVKQ